MPERTTSKDSKSSFNWQDIVIRVVIPGLLIALTGFVGEWAITSASSKSENARLVTNLQIQREKAESDLRKDIFGQAVAALISEDTKQSELQDYSKRLLKLELLALNFGDSILLSPLFSDLERDLMKHMGAKPGQKLSALRLIERLRSLAQRVANSQLSFLAQRGSSVQIRVPLTADGKKICGGGAEHEFKSPNDILADSQLCIEDLASASPWIREMNDKGVFGKCPEDVDAGYTPVADWVRDTLLEKGTMSLNKADSEKRFVSAVFSEPDPDRMSVRVFLEICPLGNTPLCDSEDENTVERTFTLDYFNFPTIDNTRLPNNDRFAVVLDSFTLIGGSDNNSCTSELSVYVVLFPSEYASLRDRPTMRESLELLERAQEHSLEDKTL